MGIQVTNKRKPIPAVYTLRGQVLETVNCAKYLGVHIDNRLNFNTHVNTIITKANGTRTFMSCNLGHSSKKVKESIYTTYICPSVFNLPLLFGINPHPAEHSKD